jgi:hypothetical protein
MMIITNHSRTDSDDLGRAYRIGFTVLAVAAACAVLWFATGALIAALALRPPVGDGVTSALPLGTLATFMTITWLPMFMPFLIPIAAAVVVLALIASLGGRYLGQSLRALSDKAAHGTHQVADGLRHRPRAGV